MTNKEKERKKVFAEILNELFEQYDQYKEQAENKQKELDELNRQGQKLVDRITAVKNLYDELVPDSGEIIKTPNIIGTLLTGNEYFIKEPVSVVEALTRIFSRNPTKEFEPVELKDELESLRKRKLLISEAENLLWITHSGLKTLMRDNYIVKNTEGNKPTYRKKEIFEKEFLKNMVFEKFSEKYPSIDKVLNGIDINKGSLELPSK